ncbi:MAG: S8 family serine peptidase [Crocosphaera sp.]
MSNHGMIFDDQGNRIDGSGYSIVVIDTGIDLDHPFFGPDLNNDGVSDRIAFHYDFAATALQNTNDPTSNDDNNANDSNGHGTHVASIAASSDSTYPGIAPGANIIALKVFDNQSRGNFYDIEQALKWVLSNREEYNIVSVNMSLSDGRNYTNPVSSRIIRDELLLLASNQVTVVSAAGNEGQSGVGYPAADVNSLAVSAVNNKGQIANFSQHHPSLTDVFAPGVGIRAAHKNGKTASLSGTSMASPVVAGAVTLAQQLATQELGRKLTLTEIRDLLGQGDNVANQPKYQGKLLNVEQLGNAILDLAPSKEITDTPSTESETPPIDDNTVIAEIGQITDFNHQSQTIVLDNNFINPVIFAQPLSRKSADPSTVRITNIQSDRFSAYLQETTLIKGKKHSGAHTRESFSFLVFEQGVWELADGTIIEVGNINTNATTRSDWQNITFTHDFTDAPVVLTQVQTQNDATFVRTRQKNTTENGFQVALEEEETYLHTGHGSETIAWLAISPGQGNWDGNTFIAGNTGDRVTHKWRTLNFGNTFKDAPKFLGNIATYDGADSSGLRYQKLTNRRVQVMIEEDTSKDNETKHTTENVNFLAIEATGTLTGGSSTVDSLTGLNTTQLASVHPDTFTLGDESESFYDNYGQQDYAEISGFDITQDIIQLHGLANDYYLGSSPFGADDQAIFLRMAGMEDELIGVVKQTNQLDLNSDHFDFV